MSVPAVTLPSDVHPSYATVAGLHLRACSRPASVVEFSLDQPLAEISDKLQRRGDARFQNPAPEGGFITPHLRRR